ncbi:MAG: hypothetical protein AAB544_00775, partial [Patescibacteria group bacterium]
MGSNPAGHTIRLRGMQTAKLSSYFTEGTLRSRYAEISAGRGVAHRRSRANPAGHTIHTNPKNRTV